MKFKAALQGRNLKFKSKPAARVKFIARAAFTKAASQSISAERMPQHIASAGLHVTSNSAKS
ncbi:hypothetical protein [uncultured Campylobacter sp.]|uniref:hypothetical protein n=1 Tax=uncultured Campylobacter sp. TaxID=218934 RepID=UPI002603B1ED|nr:hypothetical protein [uncultured Campylobacter sp.]